jgi:hypothetical protein
MSANALMAIALFLRETGQKSLEISPEVFRKSANSLKLTSIPIPNSLDLDGTLDEIVWLGAEENILIILDNCGKLLCYNMLTNSFRFLTTNGQHVFKSFFFKNSLYVVFKNGRENFALFCKVSLTSIQNQKFEMVQILPNLKTNYNKIIEIHQKSCRVITENNDNMEIWDMYDSTLIYTLPFRNFDGYKFSGNYYIFWNLEGEYTSIGILKLKNYALIKLKLLGIGDIYISQIIGKKILLAISNCHLQVIDLKTMEAQVIYKGMPSLYYEFCSKSMGLSIFRDGSAMVFGKVIRDLGVQVTDTLCYDFSGVGVICDINGKIIIFDKKKSVTFDTNFTNIQQIGANPHTHQIFLAGSGVIHILE